VPHPCQNGRGQTVIDGHLGDVHRHGDLDSGSYPCHPNKPDKEEIAGRVNQCLTLAGLAAWLGHMVSLAAFWPHSGAQRCSPARINEQHSTRSAGT
jgi:hypothetical protein